MRHCFKFFCCGVAVSGILVLLQHFVGAVYTQPQSIRFSPQARIHSFCLEDIQTNARQVTVRITATRVWGSGIIVKKTKNVYRVLTNEHVLGRKQMDYTVRTFRGEEYLAKRLKDDSLIGKDLAVLEFTSENQYCIADVGHLPKPGDDVYAAGFPFETEPSAGQGFVIKPGKVWKLVDKPLLGGYQLGYDSLVEKGMSGGPVLNRSGEVVAINGMHAYPLWGSPYKFVDGTRPIKLEAEQMSHYSWAIPIQVFQELEPGFLRSGLSKFE